MGLNQLALITTFFTITHTHFVLSHLASALGLWMALLISDLTIDQL